MATIREVVLGLRILATYSSRGDQTQINGADHDVICGLNVEVCKVDRDDLEKLGWHWDSEYGSWCRFC